MAAGNSLAASPSGEQAQGMGSTSGGSPPPWQPQQGVPTVLKEPHRKVHVGAHALLIQLPFANCHPPHICIHMCTDVCTYTHTLHRYTCTHVIADNTI